MSVPFSSHSRNHSFPPSVRYVQKPSISLRQPLPDIDDEPWAHFITSPEDYFYEEDEREQQYNDYLHFDAGILVGSEAHKRKTNKFRRFSKKEDHNIKHHHGAFHRHLPEHGYIQYQHDGTGYTMAVRPTKVSPEVFNDPIHSRPARRLSSKRNHSGHRHSWQEPSLFTVSEEVPRIVISDYDDDTTSVDDLSSADGSEENSPTAEEAAAMPVTSPEIVATEILRAPESPRMNASVAPAEKADAQLGQMWLAERARL